MAAVMKDVQSLIQAGIDPKTGLPLKFVSAFQSELKDGIKKLLRIVDEQDAVTRYVWSNLPDGLDGELLERVLYYRGQGMFFCIKIEDEINFYFLPYALSGEIDVYGRYTGVTPLPFNGTSGGDKKDKEEKPWIVGLIRKPVHSIKTDEIDEKDIEVSCVLLHDYVKQMSQTVISRQMLNEPVLEAESQLIPFMITALQNQTGVKGVKVSTQDEYSNVLEFNKQVQKAALQGEKFIPIVGQVDFQELGEGNIGRPADFMQSLESLDNFRLGLYGIENGGLFQKKAHMLESEQAMASGGSTGLVYQQGLNARQKFCDIVNSIWDLGIWCEASENQIGDMNMDGMMEDEANAPISDNEDQGGEADA